MVDAFKDLLKNVEFCKVDGLPHCTIQADDDTMIYLGFVQNTETILHVAPMAQRGDLFVNGEATAESFIYQANLAKKVAFSILENGESGSELNGWCAGSILHRSVFKSCVTSE